MTFQSRTFARFWERYDALPAEMRRQADKQYALFHENPHHPSLRLKAACQAAWAFPGSNIEGQFSCGH